MKKYLIFAALAATLASCSSNGRECISFNVDNALQKFSDTTVLKGYSETERALIGEYLLKYTMRHAAIKSGLIKEGTGDFKECSNTCEVLDYMRSEIKKLGQTEEQHMNETKAGIENMGKDMDSLHSALNAMDSSMNSLDSVMKSE